MMNFGIGLEKKDLDWNDGEFERVGIFLEKLKEKKEIMKDYEESRKKQLSE